VNVNAVDRQLQKIRGPRASAGSRLSPQAILAHLHDILFQEEGFCGNTEDYYNPMNSYLPAVLEMKKGLPITLSLIYKIVAIAWVCGLGEWGCRTFFGWIGNRRRDDAGDPFSGGRMITPDEAHERMIEQFGPEMEWGDDMLRPASNRHWITRMLQNLLNLFGTGSHYADVAAVLEMEMLLWPDQQHLQRIWRWCWPAAAFPSRPACGGPLSERQSERSTEDGTQATARCAEVSVSAARHVDRLQ